jgi:hypothetical protein
MAQRIAVQSQAGQVAYETLSRKYPMQNKAGRVAQAIDNLPSEREALSSKPSATKRYLSVYGYTCSNSLSLYNELRKPKSQVWGMENSLSMGYF